MQFRWTSTTEYLGGGATTAEERPSGTTNRTRPNSKAHGTGNHAPNLTLPSSIYPLHIRPGPSPNANVRSLSDSTGCGPVRRGRSIPHWLLRHGPTWYGFPDEMCLCLGGVGRRRTEGNPSLRGLYVSRVALKEYMCNVDSLPKGGECCCTAWQVLCTSPLQWMKEACCMVGVWMPSVGVHWSLNEKKGLLVLTRAVDHKVTTTQSDSAIVVVLDESIDGRYGLSISRRQ